MCTQDSLRFGAEDQGYINLASRVPLWCWRAVATLQIIHLVSAVSIEAVKKCEAKWAEVVSTQTFSGVYAPGCSIIKTSRVAMDHAVGARHGRCFEGEAHRVASTGVVLRKVGVWR